MGESKLELTFRIIFIFLFFQLGQWNKGKIIYPILFFTIFFFGGILATGSYVNLISFKKENLPFVFIVSIIGAVLLSFYNVRFGNGLLLKIKDWAWVLFIIVILLAISLFNFKIQ